jgi:hypothetical protein
VYVYLSLFFWLSVHGEMMDNCGKYPPTTKKKKELGRRRRRGRRIVENKLSSCTAHGVCVGKKEKKKTRV